MRNSPHLALTGQGSAHRVVVVALPGVLAFELGLAHRLLGADATRDGWPRKVAGPPAYQVMHVTVDDKPVTTSAGYQVVPSHRRAELARADTVVIPGISDHQVQRTGALAQVENAALDSVQNGTRWVSICTGAFALAARGLLDGRRCTTHWLHAARLGKVFPHLDIDPNVLFVDDGDVLTSAGNAAGIDLLLHLVRTDLGADVASRVAKSCVVAPWRDGGQAQFIDRPMPTSDTGGTAPTREWALARLHEDLSLVRLAQHAGMSVRTFTRSFREETGVTAGAWVLRARVDHARHLLERTDWSVDRVAGEAGFGTGASLRGHFRDQVGLAPLAYRRRFVADPAAG